MYLWLWLSLKAHVCKYNRFICVIKQVKKKQVNMYIYVNVKYVYYIQVVLCAYIYSMCIYIYSM